MPSQRTVIIYSQFVLRGLVLLCCLVEFTLGISFVARGQSPQVSVLFLGSSGTCISTVELCVLLSRFRGAGRTPLLPPVVFIISDVLLGVWSVVGIVLLCLGGDWPGIIVAEFWVFALLMLTNLFAIIFDCADHRR